MIMVTYIYFNKMTLVFKHISRDVFWRV